MPFLTDYGKELKKIQNEGLLEKINETKDQTEREELTKQVRERLETAIKNENINDLTLKLSEANKAGLARGGVFTVTTETQYTSVVFNSHKISRVHYKCQPRLDRVLEKNGQEYKIYVPEKVIDEDRVQEPINGYDQRYAKIVSKNWRPIKSYQIISARCNDSLKNEIARTNGKMIQDDPFASSGVSGTVYGGIANFYNHLPVRFFYSGTGCQANLKAVTERANKEIPDRYRFFRDGQKHRIEFEPFRPIKTTNSQFINIPRYALFSEVAKWNQSTPNELNLYIDGNILLTKELQEQIKGDKIYFEIQSEWASEKSSPTKFMFLYDYLADTIIEVPDTISDEEVKSYAKTGANLIITVPVSSKVKEHKTIGIINLPKDIVPSTREFIEVSDDQHFTIEVVKSGK